MKPPLSCEEWMARLRASLSGAHAPSVVGVGFSRLSSSALFHGPTSSDPGGETRFSVAIRRLDGGTEFEPYRTR